MPLGVYRREKRTKGFRPVRQSPQRHGIMAIGDESFGAVEHPSAFFALRTALMPRRRHQTRSQGSSSPMRPALTTVASLGIYSYAALHFRQENMIGAERVVGRHGDAH